MAFEPLCPLDFGGYYMVRIMVFIDFENFNIALVNYYNSLAKPLPRLDYKAMPIELIKRLPVDGYVAKTVLCAPKPDDFLMNIDQRRNTYNWINGLKNIDYYTVIEGDHIARPVSGFSKKTMTPDNPASYFVVEKGTDINMATEIVSKAFLNAYDTAVIISGDSDYIPILKLLSLVGKNSVMVGVKGQNLNRIKPYIDQAIILDESFFATCLRT
jgi:uncharacterized LabA/DUF88 family protein